VKSLLALVVALCACLACAPTPENRIVLTEHDWDAALVLERLLAIVLEERLGMQVEIVPTETTIAFAAMDRGDGSIDVAPDVWIPNRAELFERFVEPGSRESVLVNQRNYSGEQGFFVPGYIQDDHDLRHVEDLADPEIAKLFDSDGNGLGEYWVGPAGWNTVQINQLKARSYGFDELYEPVIVGEAIFKSKLEADIAAGEGNLFYYWTPEWIHAAFDLRMLEEPPFDGYAMESMKEDPDYNPDGCWNLVLPEDDPDWLEKGEIRCAFPPAIIHVAYSKTLTERHPAAARFLSQVYFDAAEIDRWLLRRAREDVPARQIAREWIDSHPEIVDEWLAGVASTAGS
jgi:glycine betaine/proline transport system substrate-binding protein